jgi:hypothetical protein
MAKNKNGKERNKPAKKARRSKRNAPNKAFELHPAHTEKITSLKPHLIEAVHQVLRDNGVDAVVHSISFRPANAVALTSGPCGPLPCCYINGVLTCPG